MVKSNPSPALASRVAELARIAVAISVQSVKGKGMPRSKPVKYACGYEQSPGSFGMWAGPFDTLQEALDEVPTFADENPVLLKFIGDRSDILYRWTEKGWAKNAKGTN